MRGNISVAVVSNIGGALCSTPQSLADAHYYMPCSNAAKTRNQLKFGGVPQTNEPISAARGPKFTILWGHMEDILLPNNLFSYCALVLVLVQKSAKKSPSGHHPTNLSGYIFATTIGKKLVKQQCLLHMSPLYGELRPTSG